MGTLTRRHPSPFWKDSHYWLYLPSTRRVVEVQSLCTLRNTPYWKLVPCWHTFSTCHTVRSQMLPNIPAIFLFFVSGFFFVSLQPYLHSPNRLEVAQHWERKNLHQKWIATNPLPAIGGGPVRGQTDVVTARGMFVRSLCSLRMPQQKYCLDSMLLIPLSVCGQKACVCNHSMLCVINVPCLFDFKWLCDVTEQTGKWCSVMPPYNTYYPQVERYYSWEHLEAMNFELILTLALRYFI